MKTIIGTLPDLILDFWASSPIQIEEQQSIVDSWLYQRVHNHEQ
ncbi:MAG: hypothetical protein AAF639_14865 [Chloroflexota bacterium]